MNLEILKHIDIGDLQGLFEMFLSTAKREEYPKGEEILRAGRICRKVYFIEKGTLHSITHSKDHGMTTQMKDTLRLMKEHNLTGLSSMELPDLPLLPDWAHKLLNKKKK